MPIIADAIKLVAYNIPHYYLVLDELPTFLFERHGNYLVAEHDGFYRCYGYETPGRNWQAFGGAKFDIPLADGTVEHAHGQWWDCSPPNSTKEGPRTSVGIATLEQLNRCYVFSSGVIATEKLNAWLAENDPSTDYEKYAAKRTRPLPV